MRRLLVACALSACGHPEAAGDAGGSAVSDAAAPQACRAPGDTTSELLLPCDRTVEPCDGKDNDEDGFTDPHCPTLACSSDADCTYGGLVGDADCNFWGEPHPICAQIDGFPREGNEACQGVLCPPGKKCVQGDCVTPGTGAPGSPCSSGADCPYNSGCIPLDQDASVGNCTHFCHDSPCPEGTACLTLLTDARSETYRTQTCHVIGCAAGTVACKGLIAACGERACATADCGHTCERPDDLECTLGCLLASDHPGAPALHQCLSAACSVR